MTADRRHILVVTGSRADYGLLYWPMKLIAGEPSFQLSVAVTGIHRPSA
jgi:UDP-N-acetylglucosamine 2-epimerase